jgi:hypothetical protein
MNSESREDSLHSSRACSKAAEFAVARGFEMRLYSNFTVHTSHTRRQHGKAYCTARSFSSTNSRSTLS